MRTVGLQNCDSRRASQRQAHDSVQIAVMCTSPVENAWMGSPSSAVQDESTRRTDRWPVEKRRKKRHETRQSSSGQTDGVEREGLGLTHYCPSLTRAPHQERMHVVKIRKQQCQTMHRT